MTTRLVKKLDFVKDYETVQVWNKNGRFMVARGYWYQDNVLKYMDPRRKKGAYPRRGYEFRVEVRKYEN